jgi:hypothetical protein
MRGLRPALAHVLALVRSLVEAVRLGVRLGVRLRRVRHSGLLDTVFTGDVFTGAMFTGSVFTGAGLSNRPLAFSAARPFSSAASKDLAVVSRQSDATLHVCKDVLHRFPLRAAAAPGAGLSNSPAVLQPGFETLGWAYSGGQL